MDRFGEDSPVTNSRKARWRNRVAVLVVAALVVGIVLLVGVTLPEYDVDRYDEQVPRGPPQSVVPTISWVYFYSLESTLNGQPLPAGAVIKAYDPQGVVCGQFRVTEAGRYGPMSVYGDDPLTEADEGAVAGDRIEFTAAGLAATLMGPDDPVWVTFGDRKQVNLAVSTTP